MDFTAPSRQEVWREVRVDRWVWGHLAWGVGAGDWTVPPPFQARWEGGTGLEPWACFFGCSSLADPFPGAGNHVLLQEGWRRDWVPQAEQQRARSWEHQGLQVCGPRAAERPLGAPPCSLPSCRSEHSMSAGSTGPREHISGSEVKVQVPLGRAGHTHPGPMWTVKDLGLRTNCWSVLSSQGDFGWLGRGAPVFQKNVIIRHFRGAYACNFKSDATLENYRRCC